ncbi:MAG: protocatechuate 3,4-dioxygenase subunit alpha [Alphaproteobacteria bacterium]
MAKQTASNTIGPFFHHIMTPEGYDLKGITDNHLAGKKTKGEHIRVEGRILDAEGNPLRAAMLEIWQANAAGRYNSPADDRDDIKLDKKFSGFGRVSSGGKGKFEFETIKPGSVPSAGNAPQAPHINLTLFAAAIHSHLFTRLYFSDEVEANEIDPVLASVGDTRRDTLIARRKKTKNGIVYRFDVKLGGEGETVFFDV